MVKHWIIYIDTLVLVDFGKVVEFWSDHFTLFLLGAYGWILSNEIDFSMCGRFGDTSTVLFPYRKRH